jgi:Mn2+/Fe2+ NRAMP family transporter
MSTSVNRKSVLLGAAFLMATSAIGPGFITQTTVYTEKLKTSFGFIILCSVLLDVIIQLTIWRAISVSGLRAQDLANKVIRGSGYFLSVLIVIGGLAFNIGNIAGAALGLQVMFGFDLPIGAVINSMIAIGLFWSAEAGRALDIFSKGLGFVMIALTGFIAFTTHPPVGEALYRSFAPEMIDTTAIIILVGGTVGGYISFAGAHRLLDSNITGPSHLHEVSKNSITAILLASSMRVLLFLAALGVVHGGHLLDVANPAASVFKIAAGQIGFKIFGLVLWAAAITSVVGSAYTSISFVQTYTSSLSRKSYRALISTFIVISLGVFLIIGKPIKVLVIVGALNGFILPVALSLILLSLHKKDIFKGYRHPVWLSILGWIAVVLLSLISVKSMFSDLFKW